MRIIFNNFFRKINKEKFVKNIKSKYQIYLYIFLFSYLLSFSMFSHVNEFIFSILPNAEITISSFDKKENKDNDYIIILEKEESKKFYNLKDSFLENKNLKENSSGFGYIKKGEYGYTLEAIYFKDSNNKININMKKAPNAKISFYNIGISKKILIEFGKNFKILDISENKEGEIIDYFPFKESKTLFVYTLISHLVLGFLIFLILNFLQYILKKFSKYQFLRDYNPKKMVIFIYILISTYVLLKILTNTLPNKIFFEDGIPPFTDQKYYWRMGKYLSDGNFQKIVKEIFSFRGYMSFVLPGIAQLIAKVLKINAFWLFFMLNNIWTALLLGYIIPELYYTLNNKKVKNYQIFFLFLIFSIFWKGMYYAVLVDLLAVTFLLYSLLLFFKYIRNLKKITAFFSGVCLAISNLSRGNYILGLYFVVILFIINNICKIVKKDKYKIKNTFFYLFFIGVFITSIPQIGLNYANGHIGLFSYDKKGSWSKKDETLKDEIMDGTLTNAFSGWPYALSDVTAQKIKRHFVNDMENKVSFKQGFSAFILNPIDTIVMTTKKLFLALNIKTSEAYPDYTYTSNSDFYVFTFLNFFLISTGFFFIFNEKLKKEFFSKKELITGSCLVILFIVPQLLFHVEWRYFILLYLIIYYIVSFKFLNYLDSKKFKKLEYFKIIFIIILVLFIVNSSYYDIV